MSNDYIIEVGKVAAAMTALSILVGVACRFIVQIYRSAKYAEHVRDIIVKMDELLERELTNNGGSSLLDKIDSINEAVANHDKRLSKIEASINTGV